MDRKIATAAAVSLAAVYGTASAAPSGLLTATPASIPAFAMVMSEQHEIIAPPSDIDPGMVKLPPATGARMPIAVPPWGGWSGNEG